MLDSYLTKERRIGDRAAADDILGFVIIIVLVICGYTVVFFQRCLL